jgi:capsular polysaccharide export protein
MKTLTLNKTPAKIINLLNGIGISIVKSVKEANYILAWGRKPSSKNSVNLSKKTKTPLLFAEDGFLRSLHPGNIAQPISIILDQIGVYYDATNPSYIENELNNKDFHISESELSTAKIAIEYTINNHITKYNHLPNIPESFFITKQPKVLIIDQVVGDLSLEYGMCQNITINDLIKQALQDYPESQIIVKPHPVNIIKGKTKQLKNLKNNILILEDNYNPISILKQIDVVYVMTSQLGFEALLLNKKVVCFGMPFYAGWGITEDKQKCERRTETRSILDVFIVAYLRASKYYDPILKQETDILTAMRYLKIQNNAYFTNQLNIHSFYISNPIKAFRIKQFLSGKKTIFKSSYSLLGAKLRNIDKSDAILMWGVRHKEKLQKLVTKLNKPLITVEDGFIRSVGLGKAMAKPMSLIFDKTGIYFDPRTPSDLENILNNIKLNSIETERIKNIISNIITYNITKYNTDKISELKINTDQKIILVPGQVENDASILTGCTTINTNYKLLKTVRGNNPKAYIIYKPHPDIVAGYRQHGSSFKECQALADITITDISIISCINACDEVHTMTSLSGFDALLRGKEVYSYGMPFYAGWGLTHDTEICQRRKKILTLEELAHGVLISYPTYYDLNSKSFMDVEWAIRLIIQQKGINI